MRVAYSMRDSEGSHANQQLRKLQKRLGGETLLRTQHLSNEPELLIQWGFKPTVALRSAVALRIPFVIIDLGYFDPTRYQRYSISINGFHGLSMPVDVLDLPPRPHPVIQPWKEGGSRIQIIGQTARDQALRGQDIEAWMNRAAGEAVEEFGMPVYKRPHPKMINPWETPSEPLSDTFEDTYVSVTWTSASAVQTVVAGVPTVAMHAASPANVVTARTMYRGRFPGRVAWAHTLSYREYDWGSAADLDAAAWYITRAYKQAKAEARRGQYDTEGVRI